MNAHQVIDGLKAYMPLAAMTPATCALIFGWHFESKYAGMGLFISVYAGLVAIPPALDVLAASIPYPGSIAPAQPTISKEILIGSSAGLASAICTLVSAIDYIRNKWRESSRRKN